MSKGMPPAGTSSAVDREELIRAVMLAVARFQDSTDLVDDAAARRAGLNRTDLRLLGVLTRAGRTTIGELATASGLSPGAATTAVDRLARAGYAHRAPDSTDRRRIIVAATPAARALTEEIWGPIGHESHQRLASRSDSELQVILAFLDEGRLLQSEHAARIAGQPLD